jgi:8-oxo-dGTP diphosphatase
VILNRAYRRLCRHLNDPSSDYAFDVVPPRFTLAELRRIYEVVIGKKLTPRVIRQHLVDRGVIVPATAKPTTKANQLYRWNRG